MQNDVLTLKDKVSFDGSSLDEFESEIVNAIDDVLEDPNISVPNIKISQSAEDNDITPFALTFKARNDYNCATYDHVNSLSLGDKLSNKDVIFHQNEPDYKMNTFASVVEEIDVTMKRIERE